MTLPLQAHTDFADGRFVREPNPHSNAPLGRFRRPLTVDVALATTTLVVSSTLLVVSRVLLFAWWMIGAFVGFSVLITAIQIVRAIRRHRSAGSESAWLTPEERFRAQLASALGRARRFQERMVVVHLDLALASGGVDPQLKWIKELRAKLRSYDVAEQIDAGTILVMLPNIDDPNEAVGIVERLRLGLDEAGDAQVYAGWCSYPHDADSADALLARARIASSVARTNGTGVWTHGSSANDTVLADAERRDEVLDLVMRATEMRGAPIAEPAALDEVMAQLTLQLGWAPFETLIAQASTRIWDERLASGDVQATYEVRRLHIRQAEQLLLSYGVAERPPLNADERDAEAERFDDIAALTAAVDVLNVRGQDLAGVLEQAIELRPNMRADVIVHVISSGFATSTGAPDDNIEDAA